MMFERKKTVGFKEIEGRTGQVYVKGNVIGIQFTADSVEHRNQVLKALKIDTIGFPEIM